MANDRHVTILLRDGVNIWNLWRKEEPLTRPDLSEADLGGANLGGAHLEGADLSSANLNGANLRKAHLAGAHLAGAHLAGADLEGADLIEADLSGASLAVASLLGADLSGANLSEANLIGAILLGAYLLEANLEGAQLSDAKLIRANLGGAHLSRANLIRADLSEARLVWTDLSGADLTGVNLSEANLSGANLSDCVIYGIAAWNVNLNHATQTNLRITPNHEAAITVDNLEVAQFLYLLLNNQRARAVLDTITSKVVLILGRFGDHKPTLDALREALRSHPNGYIPVLFDFDPQAGKPILETVKILANLARFVIADLTDPRMVRAELTAIIPNVPTVPVQPIMQGDGELPTEYASWALYKSFLPVYRYADLRELLANLTGSVIEPLEGHVHARRIVDSTAT